MAALLCSCSAANHTVGPTPQPSQAGRNKARAAVYIANATLNALTVTIDTVTRTLSACSDWSGALDFPTATPRVTVLRDDTHKVLYSKPVTLAKINVPLEVEVSPQNVYVVTGPGVAIGHPFVSVECLNRGR